MGFETIIPVFLLRHHVFTLAFDYLAPIQFNYYKNGHANIGVFLIENLYLTFVDEI